MQNHLIKTENCRNSFFPSNSSYHNSLNPRTEVIGKIVYRDWNVLESVVSGVPSLLKQWCLQCA